MVKFIRIFPVGRSGSTEKDEKPVVDKMDESTSLAPPPVDLSPLSFVLAELKLALIYVGAKWALLQNSDFDLTLENEPYHAIQVRFAICSTGVCFWTCT